MTNENTIQNQFAALTTETIRHGKAIAKLVDNLAASKVTPDDIKGSGKNAGRHVAAFMSGVASVVLSPKEFETWGDANIATKVKGELTARGTLMSRVSSRASKVRAAFERELKARDKAEQAGEEKGEGEGAGSAKRSPAEVDLEKLLQVQARIAMAIKTDKADGYGSNPAAVLMALDNAIKAFKK